MINLKQLLTESFEKDLFTAKYSTDQNKHQKLIDKYTDDNTHPSNVINLNVARNESTHPDILHKLVNHSFIPVRQHVAFHPNTHSVTLDHLSGDSNDEVRNSVASHDNTSNHTLEKLANDPRHIIATRSKFRLKVKKYKE